MASPCHGKLIMPCTVLVFDVRKWFTGKEESEFLDWDAILAKAPVIRNMEIPVDSLVGVIHNIGYWGKPGDTVVNLNMFAVILLMTPPSASRKS